MRVRLWGSVARATRPRWLIRSRRWVIEDAATLVASASWLGVMAEPSGTVARRASTAHSPCERSRSASCRSYHWFSLRARPWTPVITRCTDSSPPAAT